jgi:hypothetical protein
MTKHPGDPRADALGELPFDPNEYPGVYYTPPQDPPKTPNVLGGVPYRGAEQHGVAFQEPYEDFLPYAGEEKAHKDYIDPNITPRDVADIDPIKVEIVSNPTLIEPRKLRCLSFSFPVVSATTPTFMQIVQPERFRKRCVIYAAGSAGGTATVRWSTTPDATIVNSVLRVVPAGQDLVLFDGEVQAGIWVWIISTADPTVTISASFEYYEYDGSKLL